MFDFIPFLYPQISAVPVDNLIILPQQLFRHCNIVDIGSGGLHCMDKTAARIRAGVALHAEMPLVSLFRLVHFGVSLLFSICNNVLYSPDVGIYEDSPKTASSNRYITLPLETMKLLRQYRAWQSGERLRLGEYFQNQDFVFCQDTGKPMHPDSVTDWLKKFSKRHGLPHINPHAFRHTMASMLYFNGVDSVSISKRLGHAQVSTTANIYAHVMAEADQRNADILADVFLKKA